mgnify:CR=1 FL=1
MGKNEGYHLAKDCPVLGYGKGECRKCRKNVAARDAAIKAEADARSAKLEGGDNDELGDTSDK